MDREQHIKNVKAFLKNPVAVNLRAGGMDEREIAGNLARRLARALIDFDARELSQRLASEGMPTEHVEARERAFRRASITNLLLSEGRTQAEIDGHFRGLEKFMAYMRAVLNVHEAVRKPSEENMERATLSMEHMRSVID